MYDATKLKSAFNRSNLTYEEVASRAQTALSTAYNTIQFGRGRKGTVDAIARVLGFRRGRLDVLLEDRKRSA